MDQDLRKAARQALEKQGLSLGGLGGAAAAVGKGAWRALPVVGNIYSGGSALYNLGKGNFGEAALDAAGMIPGIGNAINFGRMGYGLGKAVGQANPPQPQNLPNYGKMAGLCPDVERTTRGMAFEAGVERFCKEASFDDDDRRAMYRMMLKRADPNGLGGVSDPVSDEDGMALNQWNNGTHVTPSGSLGSGSLFNGSLAQDPNQDPELSSWSRGQDLAKKTFNTATDGGFQWKDLVPGVLGARSLYNLASGWVQGSSQKTLEHDNAVRRKQELKRMSQEHPEQYKQLMDQRATNTSNKADADLMARRTDIIAKAKHKMLMTPGMSPETAISMYARGLPAADAMALIRSGTAELGGTAGGSMSQPHQVSGVGPSPAAGGASAAPPTNGGYFTGRPQEKFTPQVEPQGEQPMPAPAQKPRFAGNATSSMGSTPGANPMTPPPAAPAPSMAGAKPPSIPAPATPARNPNAGIYVPDSMASEHGLSTGARGKVDMSGLKAPGFNTAGTASTSMPAPKTPKV